jgi:hypothetical protein
MSLTFKNTLELARGGSLMVSEIVKAIQDILQIFCKCEINRCEM